MSDATIFVTIAFAAVWMKRKKRWNLFFQALEGNAVLASSSAIAASDAAGTGTTNTNTTPGNNPNEAPITVGQGDKAS